MNELIIIVCRSLSETDDINSADEDTTLTEHGRFLNCDLISKMITLMNSKKS